MVSILMVIIGTIYDIFVNQNCSKKENEIESKYRTGNISDLFNFNSIVCFGH